MAKKEVARRAQAGGEDGKKKRKPKTIAIQIDEDLGRMVRTIAAHKNISQAAVVRPALISYVPAQMAEVQVSIEQDLKNRQAQ